MGTKPAPFIASFSSRGPNILEESILKVCFSSSSLLLFSVNLSVLLLALHYTVMNELDLVYPFQPDITAPGVSVIAAFTLAIGPTDTAYDKRRIPFNTESGTSMSCPHVSGIVGLLKSLHPDWSPAAIRSAIMTTGKEQFSFSFSLELENMFWTLIIVLLVDFIHSNNKR